MQRGHRHPHPRAVAIQLERWHRVSLYFVFAMLTLSGALWLVFHYFVLVPGAFGLRHHPLEIWCLKLHGAFAMLALLFVGSLMAHHVKRAWHLRRNRASGTIAVAVNAFLIATGYLLYYFGGEDTRPWISALHWGVGMAIPIVLFLHIRFGRRTQVKH